MIILQQISEFFMKALIKKVLQFVLGFQNYLFVFSLFIIYTLKWNKREGDFLHLLKLLPDKGIILDIGANIGMMTVHLAKAFPNARIFAYEPIPHNIKTLKRIISFFRLKNVVVFESALGNYNGNARMIMPVIKAVKMQGLSHVIANNHDQDEGKKFITPIHKLDSYQEFFTPATEVTGIKMDVENFEYYVLDGARELIVKHHPVIYCELWNDDKRQKSISLLKEYGYEAFVLINGHLKPFIPQVHDKENFFFLAEKSSN
jgi:FkbM family methyltransferase